MDLLDPKSETSFAIIKGFHLSFLNGQLLGLNEKKEGILGQFEYP